MPQQRPRHRSVCRRHHRPKPPPVRLGPGTDYLPDLNPGAEPVGRWRTLIILIGLLLVFPIALVLLRWLLINYGGVAQ